MPQCLVPHQCLCFCPLSFLRSLHSFRTSAINQCLLHRVTGDIHSFGCTGPILLWMANYLRGGAHRLQQPRHSETSTTSPQTGPLCPPPCQYHSSNYHPLFEVSPLTPIHLCPGSSGHIDSLQRHLSSCLAEHMDGLSCKKELHQIVALPVHAPSCNALKEERWYVHSLSGKITANPHSCMIDLLGQQVAQWYWEHKEQLTATSFKLVHWASMGKAIGYFPSTFQMWLSKFASSHSAVAVTMYHWKMLGFRTLPSLPSSKWDYVSHAALPTPN